MAGERRDLIGGGERPSPDGGLVELAGGVVVADRDTPYRVIEIVMSSATEARYERMSLAVISKAIKSGGGGS